MSGDDERARRLAAIQARLNPQGEDPTSGSSTPSPLFGNAPKAKTWTRPGIREENEKRRELAREVNMSIVRDNGYAQAAGCVETLIKIATNIQESGEEKYRTLKSDNAALQKKVLAVRGGREYLIRMGFRTETRNFVQYFILDQSERRMYELGLATDILRAALPDLQGRVAQTNVSKSAHKAEEAARVLAAKRQIEDDREAVRQRTERERIVREAREKAAREAAENPPDSPEVPSVPKGGGDMSIDPDLDEHDGNGDDGDHDDDESDENDSDDEEPSVPGYTTDRRWGYGQKLGD